MHRHPRQWLFPLACALTSLVLTACRPDEPAAPAPSLSAERLNPDAPAARIPARLQHLVVIYLENRSFDNLYGEFAGADGLSNAAATSTQVDATGTAFATLPQVSGSPFPATLPNAPFPIEDYVAANLRVRDLVHRFCQEQQQIDDGRMDKFADVSDAKGEVMGFYHTGPLPLAAEAANYTLCDNFFHAAFGGSFLNHIWLIAARTPVFPNAPSALVAQLGSDGSLIKDGAVTPDGYAVNTSFTVNQPHPASVPAANLVPNQTFATIGDRLSEHHVSWAWYSGGWDDALAGHADPLFQFHHQPFAYFANYADGTAAKAEHLRDEDDFWRDVAAGTLPAVSFVKPNGPLNEHPGYTDLWSGQQHADRMIRAIMASPAWRRTAIIVSYDEFGGRWDHVAPPVVDRWGPGSRVPAVVISPFARRRFVDHTYYDTTSILKFIETRWKLAPLGPRDAAANDLTAAFDFTQTPAP